MTERRILVAGIGNIFLGDDAFGVVVAQRLREGALPAGVQVVDFGIRGFDLAYALLDEPDLTVLVDALPRGGAPGTLYVLAPELSALEDLSAPALETHSIDPLTVLSLVKTLGGEPRRVLVVGCEPATCEPGADGEFGLSPPVAAAVEEAVAVVQRLVARALAGAPVTGE
ncbi:MAG: hydrogenase maturation protease [Chloroflexi bacterium]|nr:hydrogenase maturation protease [Chloroflexota bacterium]